MAIIAHGRKAEGAVDLDAADSTGRTALHRGAFFDQVGAVAALMRGGADVGALDSCGRTPLEVAIERGSAQTAALLSTCPAPAAEDAAPPSYDELQRMDAEMVIADTAWRRRRLLVMYRARLSSKPSGREEGSLGRKRGGAWPAGSAPVAPASLVRAEKSAGSQGKIGDRGAGMGNEESSAKSRPLKGAAGIAAARVSTDVGRSPVAGVPEKGATASLSRAAAGAGRRGGGGGAEEGGEMSAKTRPLRATPSAAVGRRLPANGGDVAGVAERVLLLEEDGLFRNIVGFL
ncbi:unnamed protein product [Scytosiphon promiscuus]